jgi:hypothetical protein
MKTAYELAMERLNKNAPTVKLSDAQKKELSKLESKYAAKIAEREIALNEDISKTTGNLEKQEFLRQQFIADRKNLQTELEDKKEQVRIKR